MEKEMENVFETKVKEKKQKLKYEQDLAELEQKRREFEAEKQEFEARIEAEKVTSGRANASSSAHAAPTSAPPPVKVKKINLENFSKNLESAWILIPRARTRESRVKRRPSIPDFQNSRL